MKALGSILLLFIIFSCQSQQVEQTLEAPAFQEKIKAAENVVIVDVRTPEEFGEGYIPDAENIDYKNENFKTKINALDKNKNYFVYCLSGGRSSAAAAYMRNNGFKNVYELKGGILAWQKNNLPIRSSSSNVTADKISMDEYLKLVSSDTLVLIDFYAPWCAPCTKMKPMLEEVSKEYEHHLKVIRLNIDENKQLALKLGVEEIPILKLFKDGKEIWMYKGFIEKSVLVKNIPR